MSGFVRGIARVVTMTEAERVAYEAELAQRREAEAAEAVHRAERSREFLRRMQQLSATASRRHYEDCVRFRA